MIVQQAQYQQYYSAYSQYYGANAAQHSSYQPATLHQANYPAGGGYVNPMQQQQYFTQAQQTSVYSPQAPRAPAAVSAPPTRPGQTVLPTMTYQQALARNAAAAQPVVPPAVASGLVHAAPAASDSRAAIGPGQWPPGLKRFVERAFNLCQSDADRVYVSEKLKAQLSKVSADGTICSHNWDTEPIPDPRQKDTAEAAERDASEAKEKTKKKSRFAAPENKTQPAVDTTKSYYGHTAQNSPHTAASPAALKNAKNKNTGGICGIEVDQTTLLKRQNRFATSEDEGPQRKKNKKQAKSSAEISYASMYGDSNNQSTAEFDVSKLIVTGTCQKIEKEVRLCIYTIIQVAFLNFCVLIAVLSPHVCP